LSVFFAPTRYRVVKIARSYSKMVLRTMKNYKQIVFYTNAGIFYKIIALHPTFLILKMNSVTKGVSRELQKFAK
jgi:hypothetical protein